MSEGFAESIIEDAALNWLGELAYAIAYARTWFPAQRMPSVPTAGRSRCSGGRRRCGRSSGQASL
jgi:hypothetical protein